MKVTQEKIAEITGLSQPTISSLLNGQRRPSWKNAKKLSKMCRCSPLVFLEGDTHRIRKVFARCFDYKKKNGDEIDQS
jgi:transcriptional regulator with XRE-family HTH domain